MTPKKRSVGLARDLLIYFAFSVLPMAGFWLAGYSDTAFYMSLFVISTLVLLMFRLWHTDSQEFIKYDENLQGSTLLYVILGAMGSLMIATYLVSRYVNQSMVSSIFVPVTKLGLSVGTLNLPAFWSDVLFTLTLVAPAEEMSKLVTHVAAYAWLKDKIGVTFAKVLAIIVPIGTWATLHTYRNPAYQGSYMAIMVLTAFLAGLLIFYVMKKTNSVLAAILCHSLYNITVLYLTYNLA